jgi:2-methylcitrate dehydratase PrpD
MQSITEQLAAWLVDFRPAAMPADLRHQTLQRILNYVGVALAAGSRAYGAAVIPSALALGAAGPCHILGRSEGTIANSAALANGTMASALAFDDSQTETLIHVTATTAATAMAIAEWKNLPGEAVVSAVAAGNEIICRIGAIAPAQFHRNGFHPTGIIGAFGAAFVAGRLLGLDARHMVHAAGIVGTMAAGSNECWRDGSWAQIVDPGWAAQCGITAAVLASNGFSGPAPILEGAYGLFATHIQDRTYQFNFARAVAGLGETWESEHVSIKPYPCGHVSIPFVDCALDLYRRGIRPSQIRRVICHVPQWIIPVVCEPAADKKRPTTDWHCRVSLPYTVAETLFLGRMDASSYTPESRVDPDVLALTQRVDYEIDPAAPKAEEYKGWITVETNDGVTHEAIHLHGKDDHMSDAAIFEKFRQCLDGTPAARQAAPLRDNVLALGERGTVQAVMTLAAGIA